MAATVKGSKHLEVMVQVWDSATGQSEYIIHKEQRSLSRPAFSPDGRYLVFGVNNIRQKQSHVVICDAKSGKEIRTLETPAHRVDRVAFDRSGGRLLAIGYTPLDTTIRIWDFASGKMLLDIPADHFCGHALFSQDGRHVIASTGMSVNKKQTYWLRIVDASNGAPVASIPTPDDIDCIAFLPIGNGRWLVSGGDAKMLRIWDMDRLTTR